ncbi:cytochrome P450 [Xylariales sp. PMI_506]|nr:cytochrome P450 [Xylariales sp. PMI_506]
MMGGFVSVTSLAGWLTILFIARCLIQIIRRTFFHPFRNIPGPWINRVSELPATLALVRGDQHIYYRWLHEKYGPVVRVSPDELSFVTVDAREEIYGLRRGGLNMEKSPIFLGAVGNVEGQTGVSLALNEHHARQRRALGYLFTNTALFQQESLLQIHLHKFIDVLRQMARENKPVDFSSWYTYAAFDIMGELCFAEPFGCLDQASATEWSISVINVFIAATWTQGIRRLSGVGTWLEFLLTKIFVPAKAAEWRNIHLSNSREKTTRRLASGNREHPDFMYQILNNESKKSLSQMEIILNMALFISAGTDTTATALTGWTYFVCTHPEVYMRLVSEIRGTLGSEDDIKWENVRKLRYLEATIHEALRLFPPSPASQQRIVPVGGATIHGYYVPAGKTVAVSPWSSTHSRLNFCEPDAFRPERWLGEDERFANDQLSASLPFGTGPRVCIGRNLAYMEMRLICAHLLWNFDLALDRGEHLAKNEVWGLDGTMKTMKVFHSMTKPELWVKLKEVQR